MSRAAVLGLLLAAASAAAAERELAVLFLPRRAIAAGWDVIDEPPESPIDPELRALGLRASIARHYTRARGPVSEVCTIELWSFAQPDQAAGAGAALAQPTWWVRAAGPLLVLGTACVSSAKSAHGSGSSRVARHSRRRPTRALSLRCPKEGGLREVRPARRHRHEGLAAVSGLHELRLAVVAPVGAR